MLYLSQSQASEGWPYATRLAQHQNNQVTVLAIRQTFCKVLDH